MFFRLRCCLALLIFFWICLQLTSQAQTANLRLSGGAICVGSPTQYTATIQIRAADATTFAIGTSSVYLTYNPSALTAVSYSSVNFSPANLCIGGLATPWDAHQVYLLAPGVVNLTMTLNVNTASCPPITNAQWVDVGTVTFHISNPALDPNIQFSIPNTNFNSVPANDGVVPINKGTFTGIAGAGLLNCFGGVVVCPPPKCLTVGVTRIR